MEVLPPGERPGFDQRLSKGWNRSLSTAARKSGDSCIIVRPFPCQRKPECRSLDKTGQANGDRLPRAGEPPEDAQRP